MLDLIAQRQRPHEVDHVVRQHVQLETDLIVPEAVAGKPRPVDGVLALLDVLLRCAARTTNGGASGPGGVFGLTDGSWVSSKFDVA